MKLFLSINFYLFKQIKNLMNTKTVNHDKIYLKISEMFAIKFKAQIKIVL